jgi:integrase
MGVGTVSSVYPAIIIYCNTGLRNAELRRANWEQVDFLKAQFQVGKAKTAGSTGRVIPLNQTALDAFKQWRAFWPNAKPGDYIFPSEKLVFKGTGAADAGTMTRYAADRNKPQGSWKRAWNTSKKQAGVECRIHDLRHSFISALAQTQTTDATIQSISGHLTREMLEHYSHVRMEVKRAAVEALESRNQLAIQ